MNDKELSHLKNLFETELFDKLIPFWEQHSPDRNHGGCYNCLDRDGSIYDTRKHSWLQGRQVWMFSKLYNQVKPKDRWLEIAELGVNFLHEHAIKKNGRVYFVLNETGEPLWMQRKIFSECFYIMALAEYSRAAGRDDLIKEARAEFERVWEWSFDLTKVGRPHFDGAVPSQDLAIPMILLNVIEEIAGAKIENYRPQIEECIQNILQHIDEEQKLVLETVGEGGSPLDTIEGRLLNPGHALETSWFLQHWAQRLGRKNLEQTAVKIARWSLQKGWDDEHGGIFYFLDAGGYSPTQLEWSMKLWWPHTEAMYAFLLNYSITGDEEDWQVFKKVQEYTFTHFPDSEYNGWFGYLNRRGEVTHRFKGAPYKGFFHAPRSLWQCWQLLSKLSNTQ